MPNHFGNVKSKNIPPSFSVTIKVSTIRKCIRISRNVQSMRDDAAFIGKTWRLLLIESLSSILDGRPMTSIRERVFRNVKCGSLDNCQRSDDAAPTWNSLARFILISCFSEVLFPVRPLPPCAMIHEQYSRLYKRKVTGFIGAETKFTGNP